MVIEEFTKRKNFRWVTLKLIGLMILIFIIQLIFPQFTELFVLKSQDVLIRPWILLTSIFLHGSLTHLLFNMFSLFIFGSLLERRIGTNNFIIYFLITGLIASIAASFFHNSSLGASGAIYGVIGLLTSLRPFTMIFAFGIPMPIILASIIWVLIDFSGFSSFLTGSNNGIANIAHLTGIFSGIFFGLMIILTKKTRKARKL